MEDKYKNINSGEIVKIVSEIGNSYLLDNNKTITKHAFSSNYAFTPNIIDNKNKQNIVNIINNQNTTNEHFEQINLIEQNNLKNKNNTKMEEQIDPIAFFTRPKIDISNITSALTLGTGGAVIPEDNNNQYTQPPQPHHNYHSTDGGLSQAEMDAQYKRLLESRNNNTIMNQQHNNDNFQYNNNQPIQNNQNNDFGGLIFEEPKKADPISNLLSSAKRSHAMDIEITMDYNIPNPDFIRMMADNLEGDFIKTFADEFINSLLADRQKLYDIVYDKIKNEIYGKTQTKTKRTTKK